MGVEEGEARCLGLFFSARSPWRTPTPNPSLPGRGAGSAECRSALERIARQRQQAAVSGESREGHSFCRARAALRSQCWTSLPIVAECKACPPSRDPFEPEPNHASPQAAKVNE